MAEYQTGLSLVDEFPKPIYSGKEEYIDIKNKKKLLTF